MERETRKVSKQKWVMKKLLVREYTITVVLQSVSGHLRLRNAKLNSA